MRKHCIAANKVSGRKLSVRPTLNFVSALQTAMTSSFKVRRKTKTLAETQQMHRSFTGSRQAA
jgi:hypothetical protein